MTELVGDPMPCPAKLERAEQTLAAHENAIQRCKAMVGSLLRNGVRPMRLAR